jgi:hypothetical protein
MDGWDDHSLIFVVGRFVHLPANIKIRSPPDTNSVA